MIAKKFWSPVYESKTEYGWKVKFIPDTEWQDTSRHRDPGRVNLPSLDLNTNGGKVALDTFHQTLSGGLKETVRKPTNTSKLSQVTQGSVSFLIDTGAAHSVLTEPFGPLPPGRQQSEEQQSKLPTLHRQPSRAQTCTWGDIPNLASRFLETIISRTVAVLCAVTVFHSQRLRCEGWLVSPCLEQQHGILRCPRRCRPHPEQGSPSIVHLCSRGLRFSSHGISILKITEATEPFSHHGLCLCTWVL